MTAIPRPGKVQAEEVMWAVYTVGTQCAPLQSLPLKGWGGVYTVYAPLQSFQLKGVEGACIECMLLYSLRR